MSIRFYSVLLLLTVLLFLFFFSDSTKSCVVYDVFIDPCPEALDDQACELPQTVNASIAFKYKPRMYNSYSSNSTITQ